jgi:hypothetical protein
MRKALLAGVAALSVLSVSVAMSAEVKLFLAGVAALSVLTEPNPTHTAHTGAPPRGVIQHLKSQAVCARG